MQDWWDHATSDSVRNQLLPPPPPLLLPLLLLLLLLLPLPLPLPLPLLQCLSAESRLA